MGNLTAGPFVKQLSFLPQAQSLGYSKSYSMNRQWVFSPCKQRIHVTTAISSDAYAPKLKLVTKSWRGIFALLAPGNLRQSACASEQGPHQTNKQTSVFKHAQLSLDREQKVNWDQKGNGKYSLFSHNSIKLSDWFCFFYFLFINDEHEGYNFQTCPFIQGSQVPFIKRIFEILVADSCLPRALRHFEHFYPGT